MAIKYALFPQTLTSDPNDYIASVQLTNSADLEKIAEQILTNGSVLSKSDILALLEASVVATIALLRDGQRVTFGGLCDLMPSIQGTFNGQNDSFDPTRHRVTVGGGPGFRVRDEVEKNAAVEKVEAVKPEPNPTSYRDFQTGTENDLITPGSIGTLIGYRLKVNPAAADEGLFILNATTGASVARIATFQKNKPGELVWLNPAAAALPVGSYRLEVRARVDGGLQLRSGSLDRPLRRA